MITALQVLRATAQGAMVKTRLEAWVDQMTWMGFGGSGSQYYCWSTVLSSLQSFRLDHHGLLDHRDRFLDARRYLADDNISHRCFGWDTNCVFRPDPGLS